MMALWFVIFGVLLSVEVAMILEAICGWPLGPAHEAGVAVFALVMLVGILVMRKD